MIAARFLPIACLVAALSPTNLRADESFVSNGVKINYAAKGKGGDPVVLIHGWLSSGWINWELPGTVGLLAKERQTIWMDMPGHGASDKPTKDEAYGPELVEHVARLMDHLKIKKAHIVGYSMGGVVAAKFLVKHPDRALSGTLGGMGWLREGSFEQKLFAAGGKDGKAQGVCFRSLAKLALTKEEIESIRTPVLILFGDRDFLKKGYIEPLKAVRKDWNVIDIKDADHVTCIAKPQFREEIQKWIAQQGPR